MKVMLIGSGGREHALIKKLKENKEITELYALPGNGGMAAEATCVPIKATDLNAIEAFAVEKNIDFAVVAPDDPLVLGAVDRLEAHGIPAFGPSSKAAIIEGSKVFSKNLMKKYGIPTAQYETFDEQDKAIEYIRQNNRFPIVVKADGLALGKGVLIAQSLQEAEKAVADIMTDKIFGDSGNHIVVEEFLTGPEVSVLAFTDGKTMVPMVSSMDHKRALDGDQGLNTGGMGTVAPNPYYTPAVAERCMNEIFLPTMNAMNAEGRTFKGCLYFGLMITPEGPKVIEYNCRFGDPETQVVLPLLKTDLFTIMKAVAEEKLSEIKVEFDPGFACCVVIASGGYPIKYQSGYPISGLKAAEEKGAQVFHAGTRQDENGRLLTAGGRVLGVTATAKTLKEAIEKAYDAADCITFEGAFKRRDIGRRALNA